MARTMTLYACNTDTAYTRYRQINKTYVQALGGVQSITLNIIDPFQQREMKVDEKEYIDGELSNDVSYRRKWDIEVQPALYAGSIGDINRADQIKDIELLLTKKYLWVSFEEYENAGPDAANDISQNLDRLLPVVLASSKLSANRQKGTRPYSLTLRHRWADDLSLTTVV